MNKKTTLSLLIGWTIVMILFFFVPMAGETGFKAVVGDSILGTVAALVAGVGCWLFLILRFIKSKKW